MAGDTLSALCDVDGSTSKYCHSIQSLNNGWDGGSRIFFCLSHPCCPSSADQLLHKVCSCDDLTDEPAVVPRRPHLLMDMAKEGALLWHFAVQSWGTACCGEEKRRLLPSPPSRPWGAPRKMLLAQFEQGTKREQGRGSSEVRMGDTGSADPE